MSPQVHALKDSQLLSAAEDSETLQAITDQFAPASPSFRTVIEALTRYCSLAPPIITRRLGHAAAVLTRARLCEAQELASMGTAFDVHCNDQPFQFHVNASQPTCNKHFFLPQAVSSVFTERQEISRRIEQSLQA